MAATGLSVRHCLSRQQFSQPMLLAAGLVQVQILDEGKKQESLFVLDEGIATFTQYAIPGAFRGRISSLRLSRTETTPFRIPLPRRCFAFVRQSIVPDFPRSARSDVVLTGGSKILSGDAVRTGSGPCGTAECYAYPGQYSTIRMSPY